MSELAGSCLCGAIQYLVAAEPIMSGACHCRDCQYVSGGAPAYAMLFAKAAFKLTKGTPRAFWSISERGHRVARSFCEVCGTPLFAENATRPEFIAIKVGSLNDLSPHGTSGRARLNRGTPSIRRSRAGNKIPG